MKYVVNEQCIGCGLCVKLCPEVFEMTDANVAVASKEEVPAAAASGARTACDSCPVNAIRPADGTEIG